MIKNFVKVAKNSSGVNNRIKDLPSELSMAKYMNY